MLKTRITRFAKSKPHGTPNSGKDATMLRTSDQAPGYIFNTFIFASGGCSRSRIAG
jgi:hypothetical protein